MRSTMSKSLMRKMTMKMTLNKTAESFGETLPVRKKGKKNKMKKRAGTEYSDGLGRFGGVSANNGSSITVTRERREASLELKVEPDRPQESHVVDPKEIEHSIEKKRARVTMEAIHRAEKAKQQTGMFNVGNLTRKGGIPNNKLRGITDADFFQKNNTVEKGWTFNYDGTLVDFKKPKLLKELDEKA